MTTISIHAPAKGATALAERFKLQSEISIHAPAKGATGKLDGLAVDEDDFNPRTREGCDHRYQLAPRHFQISIHAPAKGATFLQKLSISLSKFQSTHPRRVRR